MTTKTRRTVSACSSKISEAEVRIAHSGREALTLFEEFDPAFVLLDIGMPDMDGYEVARAINKLLPHCHPVLVAFTGWGQETDRTRARDAGFDHHLVKPTDLRTLKTILETATDTRSASPASARRLESLRHHADLRPDCGVREGSTLPARSVLLRAGPSKSKSFDNRLTTPLRRSPRSTSIPARPRRVPDAARASVDATPSIET